MKIIQKQKRGLNQIFQNNKRTTIFFFAWAMPFSRQRERKEEEKKKAKLSHETQHAPLNMNEDAMSFQTPSRSQNVHLLTPLHALL